MSAGPMDAAATLRVRRATLADLAPVAELFALYRQFYSQPPDLEAAIAFLRERLRREESIVLVAHGSAGDMLGFAQVYPTFGSIELRPAWRLNDLYVRETARGRGVGEALMRAVEEAAISAGAAWVDLETALDNRAAQRLYQRRGYLRDEAFLHYVKELSPAPATTDPSGS